MATNITAQERTNILKLVAGMFNAVPGATYLEEFSTAFLAMGNDYGSLATALGNTDAFKSLYPSSMTVQETANKFLGTLGLANNAEAQDFVQAKLNAGEGIASVVFQSLLALVNSTSTDAEIVAAQAQLANKAAVAEYYSVTLGASSDDLATLQGVVANVTADPASVDAAKESSNGANGTTFMLTKGLDNFQGTAGNDTIIGSVNLGANAELDTFSPLDIINGGAGTDTLKISTTGDDITIGANVTGVEIVEASSTDALTVDTTGSADVQTLKVMAANAAIDATAAASTDIAVALKDKSTITTIDTTGGKNVSISLTDAQSDITVDGAAGAVVVNATGAALTAGDKTAETGDIEVTGGTSITVNQAAGSDAALAAGTTGAQTTLGKITIEGDAATTQVTVKQQVQAGDDGQAAVAAVAGVKQAESVKFVALTAGQSFTVEGLTFTASKALTAVEVAAAFAELTGKYNDLQAGGVNANGEYTGSFNDTDWSSAGADGDTVVFTKNEAAAGSLTTTLAASTTGTGFTAANQQVVAVGVEEVEAEAAEATVQKVLAGLVTITDTADSIKTISVDGFDEMYVADTAALETLTVANGGDVTVDDAAETLNASINEVDDVVISAGAETLNLTVAGSNEYLSSVATTALNISGEGELGLAAIAAVKTLTIAGSVDVDATSAALGALTSVDAANATGDITIAINGTQTTYVGSAGVDTVTVDGSTAISKAISLGAGDDVLDLGATDAVLPTANLDGGEGEDTLRLSAAAADKTALTANGDFAAKISGFEKLAIAATAAATDVDMDFVDGIKYVIAEDSTSTNTLTLSNAAADTTVELAGDNDVTVVLKTDTAADVLNLVASATATSTVNAAGVETINVEVLEDQDATLVLEAAAAKTVLVTGEGALTIDLTDSKEVTLVDASANTGGVTVDLLTAAMNAAVTVKGGEGDDFLTAGEVYADVLNGGAGDDTLVAGANGAKLTGGEGDDTFVLAGATKEANTYSSILDFQLGDTLLLIDANDEAVYSFTKLIASLNEDTAVFSDYVTAAMVEAGEFEAVWFVFKGNSYVVLDNSDSDAFVGGTDAVIQLVGVDLNNSSFNATEGTVALV